MNTNIHKAISWIVTKEKNINKEFKFHHLRHTHAATLLGQEVNPKYIQERLGHSKLEFILRLYTHTTRKIELVAAVSLDHYLEQA